MLEDRRMLAVFTVDSTADAGVGSLRDAIDQANATAGADEIVFATPLFSSPQTISLLSALPTITDDLTIQGPGAELLTIDGGLTEGLFGVASGSEETIEVEIADLGVTNFSSNGAILENSENLRLSGVFFTNNSSQNDAIVVNSGRLEVDQSRFVGNAGELGGAIFSGVELSVNASSFVGNFADQGGGDLRQDIAIYGGIGTHPWLSLRRQFRKRRWGYRTQRSDRSYRKRKQ